MIELRVYYDDVLRYTIIAHWDKVQELQNLGFYVKAKKVPELRLGLGRNWVGGDHQDRFLSIDDDVIIYHEDEFDVHKLAEVRPDAEHHTLGFY